MMNEKSVVADAQMRPLVLGAVRLLLLGAAAFFIESLASSTRLVALLGGVLVLEFLAGPLAFKWDESEVKFPKLAKKVAIGLGVGAGISLLAATGVVVVGAAAISLGRPGLSTMGLALAVALAQATRDELLFRGLPLKWLEGRMDDRMALPFVALLGTAPLASVANVTPQGVLITFMTGLSFAMLWRIGRGMYLVWGAHAGWLFMMASGLRGSLLDVRLSKGALVPIMTVEGASGWFAVAGVAAGALAVGWVWRRRRAAAASSSPMV